ncbi:MAG: hypothetical protein JST30_00130 [Armatimonadetes bacterium]|nr:hypothetical protein [Armatimonadota bacterium]
MIFHSILLLSTVATDCKPAPKTGTHVSAFSTNMRSMFQDSKGVYWFGSDGEGVSRYDGKSIVRYTKKDGLPADLVTQIQEDKKGDLYFTTYSGVAKYDGKTFTTLKPVRMDSPDKGWRLNSGDLWFTWNANQDGPSRYDGKKLYSLRFPKHHLEEAKLALQPKHSMYMVYTVYKDRKGKVWFGTADAGLCRYDGKTINWLYESHLTNVPGAGSFGIRSIIEDRDGNFWICNTRKRFTVPPNNGPSHGLLDYRSETGIADIKAIVGEDWLYFQSVVRGREGDLWMMPWGGGVYRYDGQSVTYYPVKDGEKDALMSQIYKDRRGDLWICSQTGGPYKFNGQSFEKVLPPGSAGGMLTD